MLTGAHSYETARQDNNAKICLNKNSLSFAVAPPFSFRVAFSMLSAFYTGQNSLCERADFMLTR
jgi:hypothetical protein